MRRSLRDHFEMRHPTTLHRSQASRGSQCDRAAITPASAGDQDLSSIHELVSIEVDGIARCTPSTMASLSGPLSGSSVATNLVAAEDQGFLAGCLKA